MRILVNSWTFLGSALRIQVMGSRELEDDSPLELQLDATVPLSALGDSTDFRDLVALLGEELITLAHTRRL